MNTTKRSLLTSVTALALCFVMLVGSTFAWFTDIATSKDNIIQTGKLDIGMYWSANNADWNDAEGDAATPIFNYDRWEPGYTEVRYIKVTNEGSLAFQYHMLLEPNGEVSKLAEVIDVSYDIVTGNDNFVAPTADNKQGSLTKVGTLNDLISNNGSVAGGVLLPNSQRADGYYSGEIVVCISFHMQENAGNEYQNLSIGTTFGMKLYATQFDYENDSYDNSYDDEAAWPEIPSIGNDAFVEAEVDADGKVATPVIIEGEGMSANIPEGVQLAEGNNKLSLNVKRADANAANVTIAENEEIRAIDVHISGVAEDNTVPMAITLAEALPVGLNLGNYTIHHVENGQTVEMTLLQNGETPAHNTFAYDPATGDVVLYLASFSVIALIADTENTWGGEFDYEWYTKNPDATEFYIANADQLAAFGAIVGGMYKVTGITKKDENVYQYTYSDEVIQDSFKGKTVTLLADINIGDTNEYYDDASENGLVFYPIGYYNTDGTYERTRVAISSGFRIFEGTFDGDGRTISNFYQNTWEMKGDHNWYAAEDQYYRDGMGLFGRVYGGTIRNLTINNFSCDGEITTTGCVAAYADHGALFENIAVINSNPRVYNIGNGGIVGVVGWYEKEATNVKVTFRNITVDNTNKISALWGSYDVPCGGIVGTYYPTSGQSSAGYPKNPGISFENCHVGAQLDVNNDVAGNYQYYAYRYAGMLMGMVYENVTGSDGRVYPDMTGIQAADCTIHFGTWNDYYYCELIDNTTASYTHDYQMSRLVEIQKIDIEGKKYLPLGKEDATENWVAISTSGRANFVIVDYEKGHGDENAQCYHFLKGEVWEHEDGGYHDGTDGGKIIDEDGDGNPDLREDKQHLYLEFNNLVTGNGWGVTSKYVGEFDGVTILDRTEADSIDKFEGRRNENGKLTYPVSGREYKISHIFNLIETDVRVIPGALTVTVTNLDEDSNVTAEFTRSATSWADSTIVFNGNGRVRVTIQDYFYCNVTSVDLVVRSYPEGSIILNFTYDGFDSADYIIPDAADEITTGKHGTYDYDFGFGPEVLDHALKIDSKGSITFNATSDGKIVIALASNTVGASLDYKVINTNNATGEALSNALNKATAEELLKIYEANKLIIVSMDVTAGKTYHFLKGEKETAIYYIGYLPTTAVNAYHDCAYYETTTATCTKGGTTTRTCLVCGDSEKYTVNALGHHYVDTEAYDSTCTSKGKTAGTHCVNCGDVKVASKEIDKKQHVYQNDICINCGGLAADLHTFKDGVCTGCGTKIEDANNSEFSYVITHSIDFTTGKSEDYSEYRSYFLPRGICTIDGSGRYVIMKSLDNYESYIEFTVECPVTLIATAASTDRNNTTNFILEDVNGNTIFERNNRVQANGADGTTFIYTISEAGTYRFICTSTDRVGRLMSMKIAESHTYTIETITKAPTCTEVGEKTLSCNCGQYITETIPATGHNFVNGVCSVCQAEDTSSCRHTNKTETVVPATCTTAGYTTYTCDNCGLITKGAETPALGHTEVVDEAVAPTCDNTGLTEGKHCSVCNKVIVAQTTIAKVAHNYGDGDNCTVCGIAKPVEGTQVHSFTDNGATDPEGFFTISGNLRGDNTLKLQSTAGSISFTPAADGKVTVQFIGATSLKINGSENNNIETVDGITILTFVVKEGTSYEITKGSGEALVSYIEYTPGDFSDLEEPHTHIYVNGKCECGAEDPGYVAPHEHVFVNGTCSCGEVDPNYGSSTNNDKVINFSEWEEFPKNTYADGETVKYNEIFTFIYGGNSRVDSSSKTWDDFSGTKRFSFGGKTNDGVPTKNALKITADGSYTIKIWYVAGGNGRYFELRNAAGTAISTTTKETTQNAQYYSELVIPEAGTYYLTIPADNQYIFQIELVAN